MRASFARSRNRGHRAARRERPTRQHATSQILLVLSLLIGLFTPLTLLTPPVAAQQGGQFPPPLPAPSRVALAGS
ncbi:MAG: hypothetical protein ACRDJC_08160, partial [Thermomicrobiales bacterium]